MQGKKLSVPALIAISALVLTGCGTDDASDGASAAGDSRLKPHFEKKGAHGKRGPGKHRGHARDGKVDRQQGARDDARTPGTPGGQSTPLAPPGSTSTEGDSPDGSAPSTTPASPSAPATPAGPPHAHVSDARGDTGGPAYIDLVGADLTRDGATYRLVVDMAGSVPARGDSDTSTNVASFYDVDGDGAVDYEVWGTLADNGWSTSYRYPDGARYGSSSGVGVRASGSSLTFTFPAGHLGGANAFRFSVGAEHGTFAQVGSGTTVTDSAPEGSGSVSFPG